MVFVQSRLLVCVRIYHKACFLRPGSIVCISRMLRSSLLYVDELRIEWITGSENFPSVRSSQKSFAAVI